MRNSSENTVLAVVDDPRWHAVITRNREADGTFYYSVNTTGVYCRPSCAARRARPEHVHFHLTCAAAEQAGFRPCKRCKPDQPALLEQHTARIIDACHTIETAEHAPTLTTLAAQARLSTYHFHRLFKQITGLTPGKYAAAQRARRMRNALELGSDVTTAIYDAGYQSNSRFYEKSEQVLGMTASRYRNGGIDTQIRFAVGECSLGAILVAHSGSGVCAILLGDDPDTLARDLQDRFPRATLIGGDASFEQTMAAAVGLIDAPHIGCGLPLDMRGTAFQQRVWQALRDIPAGQTVSYTELANRIGAPTAVRAVASACAANALAVAIPCHRVVRNDGALSGYRWGVERKRALLDKEAQQRTNADDDCA